MGIISRPRSNPAMIRALARYCSFREVTGVEEDRARETLAPATLITGRGGDGTAAVAGSAWRDSIDLAVELQILEREDGALRFRDGLLVDLGMEDLSRFRRALRRVVLA